MKPPVFSLVRRSDMNTSEVHQTDYVTSAEALDRFDEVELLSPLGEPAATPVGMGTSNLDYIHKYVDASEGEQARMIGQSLTLSIDWIGSTLRRKLDRWMRSRARVLFTPGYGRDTVFAWRPYECADEAFPDGAALTDLLGKTALTVLQDEDLLLWDEFDRVLRGGYGTAATPQLPIIATPFGAGYASAENDTQRWYPMSPQSAVEGHGSGDCGWVKGGTDSADISLSLVTNGFGHTDCPHSLRVQTSGGATSLAQLEGHNQWDSGDGEYQGYSWTGTGTAVFVVFLRGRLCHNAALTVFQGANFATIAAADMGDLSEWTPIVMQLNSADWTANLPNIYLTLNSSPGDRCDFEIGPSMAYQVAARHAGMGAKVSASGAAISSCRVEATIDMPATGSVFFSVYIPESMRGAANARMGLMGDTNRHFLVSSGAADAWVVAFDDGTSRSKAWTAGPEFDAVNTFCFVWGHRWKALYANGVLLESWVLTSEQDSQISGSATTYIGEDMNDYRCYPGLILGMRIDRKQFSGDEIEMLHKQCSDPGASESVIQCRGRLFKIEAIPSTAIPSPAGTRWAGNLKLGQVGYLPQYADLTNKEMSNA